jgi:hypothetical protein
MQDLPVEGNFTQESCLAIKLHVVEDYSAYMGFDSLARFLGEISFNKGSVHFCQNVRIPPVFPANRPYGSPGSYRYVPLFIYRDFGSISRGIPRQATVTDNAPRA